MKLVQLAARNLFRNLRRTLITLMAITFGLAMIHFTITLQTGSYDQMIHKGISTLAGHVVVQGEGYQEDRDADIVVQQASEVAASLANQFPDATIAPRIFLGGLLNSTTSSIGVALSGIDVAAEADIQDLDDKIISGTWLDDDSKGLVIGAKMAEGLGVEVGDKVVYMGQHGGADEMTSRLFRIKGIFRTGAAEIDGFAAFAPIDAARTLLGLGDAAHQVTVHLVDAETAFVATDEAKGTLAAFEGIEVLSWREALPELYGLIQIDRTSSDFILTILGIIVTMGVLNTVLMSALERTREFGVMMALGMKPRTLARMILMEGALLGVFGSALGFGVGLLVSWPMVVYGLDYGAMTGMETMESAGIALDMLIFGQIDLARMGVYTAGAIALTALAAVYPAVHVSRLQPVAAMNHI